MANSILNQIDGLPEWLFGDPVPSSSTLNAEGQMDKVIVQLIISLRTNVDREPIISALAGKAFSCEKIAVYLWDDQVAMFALLMEVSGVYREPSTSLVKENAAARVCKALTLLQCLAAHPYSRPGFIRATLPSYMYVFLETKDTDKFYEYIRVSTLGVIGALAKSQEDLIMKYLFDSSVFHYVINGMEIGGRLSKMVGIYVVHNLLRRPEGVQKITVVYDRFERLRDVMKLIVDLLADDYVARFFEHVVGSYLLLSEHPRACDGLRNAFPRKLSDNTFKKHPKKEHRIRATMQKLIRNVTLRHVPDRNYRFFNPPHVVYV